MQTLKHILLWLLKQLLRAALGLALRKAWEWFQS